MSSLPYPKGNKTNFINLLFTLTPSNGIHQDLGIEPYYQEGNAGEDCSNNLPSFDNSSGCYRSLLGQIPIVQSIRENGDAGKPAALSSRPDGLAFLDLAEKLVKAANMP